MPTETSEKCRLIGSLNAMEQENFSQEEVRTWFDRVYQTRGLSYLRPVEAYPIFLRLLGVQSGQALLDVACGPGLLLREAVHLGLNAQGVDISTVALAMVPQVAPGALAAVGNAESLPFADGLLDYVTCIGSVERFLNRERALGEMQRVAKPQARFCIMVRNSRTISWKLAIERLHRRNHSGHQNADNLERWSELFRRSGFIIEEVLPDQWFRRRVQHLIPVGLKGQREGMAHPILPLRFANEFIFLMRIQS